MIGLLNALHSYREYIDKYKESLEVDTVFKSDWKTLIVFYYFYQIPFHLMISMTFFSKIIRSTRLFCES